MCVAGAKKCLVHRTGYCGAVAEDHCGEDAGGGIVLGKGIVEEISAQTRSHRVEKLSEASGHADFVAIFLFRRLGIR